MSAPADWCPVPPASPNLPPVGRSGLAPIEASSLCARGWRPLMITGLLRDLLARHFSEPLDIEEPDLRHLIWREGTTTGILVESIHRFRPELVNKRPAVIIKRNAMQNLRLGIGDSTGATGQGVPTFKTYWVGSHTLFCLHESGASVEILATEVQRELTQFAPLVSEYLGLPRWQVTEVGEISEVEEARETLAVPVTVGWAYEETWALHKQSLKLRKITLSALLDGALFQGPSPLP